MIDSREVNSIGGDKNNKALYGWYNKYYDLNKYFGEYILEKF